MSHQIQQVPSTKAEEPPAGKLPESSMAYQATSQGPLLTPSLNGWDFFWYIISFQWVAAWFSSSTSVNTSRSENVEKLLEHAQELLVGRIPKKEGKIIHDWLLNQASPEWLGDFAKFLNEAERLEALKPKEFPLAGTPQTQRLTEELHVPLLSAAADHPLITDMLTEIIFLTIVHNTQPIEATLKTLGDRSKPYLHSAYASKAPFTLLFEIHADQNTLLITDPSTKQTRTIQFDPEQGYSKHHLQLAQAIYDLPHPSVPGGSSTQEKIQEAIQAGSIYAVNFQGTTMLSLSNRMIDLSSTGFMDRKPIATAQNLIATGEPGKIEMPILSNKNEEINLIPELSKGFCNVAFAYQSKTYQTHYPVKEGETLEQLAMRITKDHTLERDLLLARSFFARTPS